MIYTLINLRDYQIEAIDAILETKEKGINRQLICLPTGSGKTILMAALAKRNNKKTLIIAHREELIHQAYEKIKLFWPEASIGLCMADQNEINAQVVIGSVQSCSRPKRLAQLAELDFDLLMIDEAHHASAESYQNLIQALGFERGSSKLLVGVTATPERSDKYGLGDTFDKLTYSRSIGTMIKAGYLTPVVGRKILTSFELRKLNTNNGDFALQELSEAINTPERNAFVAEKYQAYAAERKGVVFCVDVQHCQDMAQAFNERGVPSKAIWGDMESIDRKNVVDELKNGNLKVAMSCGVLTEGFDEPSIGCIVMARPTKSKSLYIQCVGRGLRTWPGKPNCLVLDFTDRGHNLDSVMSLKKTIPESAQVFEDAPAERSDEVDRTPKIQITHECDQEFDILGTTKFLWVPIGDDEWSLLDDDRNEIVLSKEKAGYIATLYLSDGSKTRIVQKALPLEYCSGIAEDYARRHLRIAFADTSTPWMNGKIPATLSQIQYLEKKGAYKAGMSKTEASHEIRKLVALKNKQRRALNGEPLTIKQKYTLTGLGINPRNMTKYEAMREISRLKQQLVHV